MRAFLSTLTIAALAFALTATLGCSKGDKGKDADKGKEADKGKGAATTGKASDEPGWLFAEPNDKYHMRLEVNAKDKKASVKVLDESAKQAFPIEADSILLLIVDEKDPVKITLTAKGDKGKKTAHFEGTHERLAKDIKPKEIELRARIDTGPEFIFKLDEEHAHGKDKK